MEEMTSQTTGSPDTTSRTLASKLLTSSYRSLGSPKEVGRRFLRFLLENTRTLNALNRSIISDIELDCPRSRNVVDNDDDDNNDNTGTERKVPTDNWSRDISLEIDAFDLILFDPELGHMLLRFPSTLLPLLEEAADEAQRELVRRILHMTEIKFQSSGGSKRRARQHPSAPQCQPLDSTTTIAHLRQLLQHNPRKIHGRLIHLPPHMENCKPSLSSISASDVGKVVQISGTVVRASPVRMVECSRAYRCRNKSCNHTFIAYADFEQKNNALSHPTVCPMKFRTAASASGSNEGGGVGGCDGTSFDVITNEGLLLHTTDYQEIKILESISRLAIGSIPRSILIKLEHDLVDSCHPGDEVFVVGSLISQWQPVVANVDCNITMALRAHSIQVVNTDDHSTWEKSGESGNRREAFQREFDEFWTCWWKERPIAARNEICKAVCPKLYGMLVVKLGLLLSLIGGTSSVDLSFRSRGGGDDNNGGVGKDDEDESSSDDEPEQFSVSTAKQYSKEHQRHSHQKRRYDSLRSNNPHHRKWKRDDSIQIKRRAQSHILLVGDPGTGKSHFLRFAAALSPRSVLTTGVGTTSAGLTCAAIREGGSNTKEFTLEAGALVLADRGVCCIDEFGCIREEDRTTIHEAMEQQTISVAKAGIVCKLNSRATVIAVMNPKSGLYEIENSLLYNTNLGSPLLSRFDLIFVMVDQARDVHRDDKIAAHLLNRAINGSGYETTTTTTTSSEHRQEHWSMDKLRAYIATIKERFQPKLSAEAARLLQKHYHRCREMQQYSSIQITVRFLESLIRLSQAHARLMYRDEVTLQDAVAVILILECSAATSGGLLHGDCDPEDSLFVSPIETDFPGEFDADEEFREKQEKVLRRYDMLEDLPIRRHDPNNDGGGGGKRKGEINSSCVWTGDSHDENDNGWNDVVHPRDVTSSWRFKYGQMSNHHRSEPKNDQYDRPFGSPMPQCTGTPSSHRKSASSVVRFRNHYNTNDGGGHLAHPVDGYDEIYGGSTTCTRNESTGDDGRAHRTSNLGSTVASQGLNAECSEQIPKKKKRRSRREAD